MFDIPLETSTDFLNFVLAVGFTAITFFLCLVLIRLFRILGILGDLLEEIQDTLEIVQTYLWQPARFFMGIFDKARSFLGIFGNRKK